MKKILLVCICALSISSGCQEYDVNVKQLVNYRVKFSELPESVQDCLNNPSSHLDSTGNQELLLINLSDAPFELDHVKTTIGPWTAYFKLVNTTNSYSYKIDQGEPFPFLIFDEKLYIATSYNFYGREIEKETMEFNCYELKP